MPTTANTQAFGIRTSEPPQQMGNTRTVTHFDLWVDLHHPVGPAPHVTAESRQNGLPYSAIDTQPRPIDDTQARRDKAEQDGSRYVSHRETTKPPSLCINTNTAAITPSHATTTHNEYNILSTRDQPFTMPSDLKNQSNSAAVEPRKVRKKDHLYITFVGHSRVILDSEAGKDVVNLN